MKSLDEIHEAYGFPGIPRLWSIIKQNKYPYSYNDVVNFIQDNETSQLHKRSNTKGRHITAPSPYTEYQMDLLDMTKFGRQNRGMNWILIVIDIFTRKAAAIPLKSKSAENTAEGLEKTIDELGKPLILSSDNGKEFMGATKKYMKDNNILHKTNDIMDHKVLGIIDRFSGTLKNMLYKYFTKSERVVWVNVLPKFIDAYNDTIHSTIGISPNTAEQYPTDTRNIHALRNEGNKFTKSKLKIGDYVRIKQLSQIFDKGYEIKFSVKIHQIIDKQGSHFTLENGDSYRGDRLQKVKNTIKIKAKPIVNVNIVRKIKKKVNLKKALKKLGLIDALSQKVTGIRQRKKTFKAAEAEDNIINQV